MLTSLASFLPPAASTSAEMVDRLFIFILIVCVFFFAIVTIGTVYLVWRYRRHRVPRLTSGVSHNTALEILWSVIPGIILIVIFFWGFQVFMHLNIAPGNAMEIRVTARKWTWMFKYPDGVRSAELVVPVDRPIKLVMSSDDVIHSLFIPDFRVKMDVLPYRYTTLWFQPNRVANFDLFCTEYCGDQHSRMHTLVKVVSEEDYRKWLTDNQKPASGEDIYRNFGCVACHSLDGTSGVGPTWKGLFGHEVTVLENGAEKQVTADDNYLRESILQPMAKIVKNYQPVMPPPPELSSEELDSLIDFIKSLKE